jgi:hypothetical protein
VKIGTESPAKTGFAIALGVVALFLLFRWYTGNQTPADSGPARTRQTSKVNPLDPALRTDLLKDTEQTKYESKGRNIFVTQVEIPKQVEDPRKPAPVPVDITPPAPPPINIKFFGFANKPGEPKKIFLSQGEDIFVAREGEIVNRRYRVLKINSTSVDIEDVLSNNRQSIPLTQS